MTLRLPGSLVNRALRSRLLSAQQHRAATAAQNLPSTWNAINATRAFSDHPNRTASYERFENPRLKPSRQKLADRPIHRNENKRGNDSLMAIASNSHSARYDHEIEIAESEALDTAAAGRDGPMEEQAEGEAVENEHDPEEDTADDKTTDDKTPETKSYHGLSLGESRITPKIVNMELRWLNDPHKMADRIDRILQNGEPALAAAIVRAGTKKGMRCDVAWNHLLQYCMDQKSPQAAFKFYNDMKKRGRRPNMRTYTIMLKGFSSVPMSPSVVKTAASVYRSISAENSGVKLSIIHTNAMLTVCHRHADMDRLWQIAGELPEEGPGAPDATTYTIILNAVQFAARRDIQKMSPDEIDKILERKTKAITEGKRIWADIVYRWKTQTLELDNDVVNGMASLLLDGASDMDCYNVMELYKQTMGLPILQKRPTESSKTTRRRITHEETQAIEQSEMKRQEKMEDLPFVDENNKPLGPAETAGDLHEFDEPAEEKVEAVEEEQEVEEMEEEEETFEDLFKPVVPGAEGLSFLKPKSKELTLLLNACFTMTQGTEGGLAYWKYMTLDENEHRFRPDAITYAQYFRLLRISRSSKISVKTMRDQMVPSGLAHGTAFHIALSVCRRDRRNHSVLLHANELIGLMDKALILPDIRVLDGYLETIQILSANSSVLLNLRGLSTEEDTKSLRLQDRGAKLQAQLRLNALATLRSYVSELHEAMENGKPEAGGRWSNAQNRLANPIHGPAAVKFMARVRLIVDDTLKLDYKKYVSKAERKILMGESQMLKKYSDKQTIAAWKNKLVYPTADQKDAARERIYNYRESVRLEQARETTSERSHGHVDSSLPKAKLMDTVEAE
ncbi:uncharacterized protein N7506_007901 [Penicillium brevicompactum]|uniref:uncharacterized protein n=1 Tax=Penicillium brevicompactum TaxID=5074 RepID=UPI00253FB800|nr:uncharacterized protein N7506_007901 [Penicillium brevicompactum]KAJ5334118.1 hypothetical protein N7506_007901 [Penicillium brevicompactum]